MFFPNYMLPLIFRGKSLVSLTEDIFFETKFGSLPLKYKLAYRVFAGHAARNATAITAVSKTSAKTEKKTSKTRVPKSRERKKIGRAHV